MSKSVAAAGRPESQALEQIQSSDQWAVLEKVQNWFVTHDWTQTGIVLLVTVVSAVIIRKWLVSLILRLAKKTDTQIDDEVVRRLGTPLYVTVILIGSVWLILDFFGNSLGEKGIEKIYSVAYTIGILFWAGVGSKIMTTILNLIADQAKNRGILSADLLPVFNFLIIIFFFEGKI